MSTNYNYIQHAYDIRQTFRALYKPNPIFIPRYVSVKKQTLRIHLEHFRIHWSHYTSYFFLALSDPRLLSYYNQKIFASFNYNNVKLDAKIK